MMPDADNAPLTTGNAAKLYCLQWIARWIEAGNSADTPVTLLDLGCGNGQNFVTLLRRYPQIAYTGVEPSAQACAEANQLLSGLNAVILHDYAYDGMRTKLPHPQYDLVVSFSVFEHVYRRLEYLQVLRSCLKDDGWALINYDSGHFHQPDLRERFKNLLAPVLARLGDESRYQAFVREADFRTLAARAGLRIVDAKSFNTRLKGVYKHVPAVHQAEFMRRWLELEEWLNDAEIVYDDSKAPTWYTRNFILRANTAAQ